MKTGSANLNFLRNFSQLPLSNISLFTALFTAYVGFFRFLACFLVRDMFSSGCRNNYPPPPTPTRPTRPTPMLLVVGGGGGLGGSLMAEACRAYLA